MEVVELEETPTHHINYAGDFDAKIAVSPVKLLAAKSGNAEAQQLISDLAYTALIKKNPGFKAKPSDVLWGPKLEIKVIRGRHVRR
jgi:hypothetical protein